MMKGGVEKKGRRKGKTRDVGALGQCPWIWHSLQAAINLACEYGMVVGEREAL